MPDYKVPVNDYLFLFNDVLDMQSKYKDVQGGDEATTDMVEAIFTEAAKFCENELAPIYQSVHLCRSSFFLLVRHAYLR